MVTVEDLLPRISYHAVARYVQRILLVDVPDAVFAMPTLDRANEACRLAGTSIDEVRREMLNPALAAAMLGGFTHMSCALFTAKLQKSKTNGLLIVTTVNEPRAAQIKRAHKGRMEIRTKREHRRECHKYTRRRKGHP